MYLNLVYKNISEKFPDLPSEFLFHFVYFIYLSFVLILFYYIYVFVQNFEGNILKIFFGGNSIK